MAKTITLPAEAHDDAIVFANSLMPFLNPSADTSALHIQIVADISALIKRVHNDAIAQAQQRLKDAAVRQELLNFLIRK